MKYIPDGLVELIDSKKGGLFLFLFAAWTPGGRSLTGLDENAMQWLSIGFCGFCFGQGLKDLGLALAGSIRPPREKWNAKAEGASSDSAQPPVSG